MIFALVATGKGRVERAAGSRLVTELRDCSTSTILEANRVTAEVPATFQPAFGVVPRYTPSLHSGLWTPRRLEILCPKHKRRVARDSITVRFQLIQQLRQGRNTPAYAGAAVGQKFSKAWTAGCQCGMKAAFVPGKPPNPVFLRNGSGRSNPFLARRQTAWANLGPRLSDHWTQGQSTRTIHGTVRPRPQPAGRRCRASRRSFRKSDGR